MVPPKAVVSKPFLSGKRNLGPMAPTYAVFGAGGPTGQEVVKAILETGQENVRAVVRDPSKYASTFSSKDRVTLVAGDVTNPASIASALEGVQGAVFAASGKGYWSADSVDHKGVANVAAAAKTAGLQRVVLVSSAMVTPKNRWHPIRLLLNNIRWGLMDAKFKGENTLRSSGVPYTIVRPAGLSNAPGGQSELIIGQGDHPLKGRAQISRADVARVCVEALRYGGASNRTFELSSKPPSGEGFKLEEQLKTLLTDLKPDTP